MKLDCGHDICKHEDYPSRVYLETFPRQDAEAEYVERPGLR